MKLTSPLKDSIFKRFFPSLFPRKGAQTEHKNPVVPSIENYQGINGSLQKLNKLSADLLSEKETLQDYIAEQEEKRTEYLCNEAIQGASEYSENAPKLLNEVHQAQQRLSDIDAMQKNIMDKKQIHEAERNETYQRCKQELGKYLNARFSELAAHYHNLTPEIKETVLQIQAVQDLMIQLHTGNSNGFDGSIRLPTIEHGNGNTLDPFLENNSLRYKTESNDRKEEILIELRASGYPVRR